MTTEAAPWSASFKRLYCDATLFDSFSSFHPISFKRVLPFQSFDEAVDDCNLLAVEEAYLAARSDATRLTVVQEYCGCGLLSEDDATNLKSVIDYFDTDFFELMGLLYANAGKFRCALRWYREQIRLLEAQNPNLRSDEESVYASVGYSLYSLGLFEEAIAWSKSCIGPQQMADTICQSLIDYEVQSDGGQIVGIERSGTRTRYTVSFPKPGDVNEKVARLKTAIHTATPWLDIYIDWIKQESPAAKVQPEGYPFKNELGGGSLLRHRMNLIFATCGHADALAARGYIPEARRLLTEAAMLEPNADFISERLEHLNQ